MNLAEKFLSEIAEIMEFLSIYNAKPKISPKILVTSSLIIVFLVAFSKTLYFVLATLAYMMLLIIILKVNAKVITKVIVLALFLSIIPAVPLIISKTGYISGLNDLGTQVTFIGVKAFITFVLRVIVSSGIFVVPIAYFGWSKLLAYLEYWKPFNSVVSILKILVTTIPKTLRHMLSLLVAREARIFNNDLSRSWKTLSSVVGDVLLACNSFSKELILGINARTFGKDKVLTKTANNNLVVLNIIVLIATAILITLYVMVEIFGTT